MFIFPIQQSILLMLRSRQILRHVLVKFDTITLAVQLVVCDSPAGRLGLTVCYDLRFPEMYQRLAFTHGAQVLLLPSAFTKVTGMRNSKYFIDLINFLMPQVG